MESNLKDERKMALKPSTKDEMKKAIEHSSKDEWKMEPSTNLFLGSPSRDGDNWMHQNISNKVADIVDKCQ